jgi:radical SAM protein with 4Fe4S-binding SPASM domain
MDIAIILTYRCNSRCSMCNIWKNPSLPEEEISVETLAKIPEHVGTINLTGGEPTLRRDLGEIVDLLYPRAQKFEISSNGLLPEKIEPIIKKYPDIKIRFSLEGNEKTNNMIRGEKNGFRTKVDGLARLKELGGKDLGFAVVIQDDNVADLVELFRFAEENGYELSTSTLHNGFQFHKNDNIPYNRLRIAHHIEGLIIEQLKTNTIKNWFRAYIDLGLIAKVLGNKRLLACKAGNEILFIDPWGDVFACNVRPDLYMGNLGNQLWPDIISGQKALQVLEEVNKCQQNCWMVGTAKGSMRNHRFPKLPRLEPFAWVVHNKIRLLLGKNIDFQYYVEYPTLIDKTPAPARPSHLDETVKRKIQTKNDQHYSQPGGYINQ